MKGDFHVRFCERLAGEIPLRDPIGCKADSAVQNQSNPNTYDNEEARRSRSRKSGINFLKPSVQGRK